MSVLVGTDTKLIVQGMTGRAGTFYTDLATRYGTRGVGGVRPGKGGARHLGLPLFNTVAEAVTETGANASLVMVPPHNAAAAMIEAIEAEIGVAVCVTERVPVLDMLRVKSALQGGYTELVGPNSQGVLAPDICKIGVMSTSDAKQGIVGIVSRSASLTSEIVAQTSAAGLGQSTTIGVGGDPIHGIGFRRCLDLFRKDDGTKAVVLIGEIGGSEEEEAAEYLASIDYRKPVVSLVVGRHAPRERRMGHAGTLEIFRSATATEKAKRLQAAGSIIASNVNDVVPALRDALASPADRPLRRHVG